MAKPLTSEEIGKPQSVQFAHFGVLNDGAQSKASTMTAVGINILLAFVIIVVGAATKKTIDNRIRLTALTAPVIEKKVEPVKPKIAPPKLPKLPDVPKLEVRTPQIVVPEVKLPDPPKMVVKMDDPKPIMAPPAPKQVVAAPAPKVVNLAAAPAAVVNTSTRPTAIALGSQSNPLAPTNAGPSAINLGNKGANNMSASNTGLGRPTTVNLGGSGSPNGSDKGTGAVAVTGLAHGVTGGTGPLTSRATGVNLAVATPPPSLRTQVAPASTAQHPAPKVLFKPKPEYSAEAVQMHLEGTVTVHIRVLPNGTVQVVGVTNGLGHGLDESARRAVQATRFEPATDASGHPVEWDGFVNVAFQLAG